MVIPGTTAARRGSETPRTLLAQCRCKRLGGGAALRKPNQTLKIVEWSVAQENRKPEQKRCHVGALCRCSGPEAGGGPLALQGCGTGDDGRAPPPCLGDMRRLGQLRLRSHSLKQLPGCSWPQEQSFAVPSTLGADGTYLSSGLTGHKHALTRSMKLS